MSAPAPGQDSLPSRRRVLFLAEAVTLAHVARPLALAAGLDTKHYEIHLACAESYASLIGETSLQRHTLHSLSPARFKAALAGGRVLYDAATLRAYVEEDLRLLHELRPDVVVGDFRLSLSISARLAGIPYLTISNAYWSPYRAQHYPVPELPLTRLLGVTAAQLLFNLVRPLAFALHSRPLNQVRREFGLASLGRDLRRVYTDADYTLYADPPELFPLSTLPDTHRFLGPVLWSPALPLPTWWDTLPNDKPCLYVTLGSSGNAGLLPRILAALAGEPVTVIAAGAGQKMTDEIPGNAYIADYLPGGDAARRAKLVICNGGSPTSQQALLAGVPVLGIPANLDQHLNMTALEKAGVGRILRSEHLRPSSLRNAVRAMLTDEALNQRTAAMAETSGRYSAPRRFAEIVQEVIAD